MTDNSSPNKRNQKNGEFIPNFTQYPNEILDNWMPHLSGNQTKIMNVFVRQIYGFHKDYDKISVRQISSKTGIPIGGVFRDLKILLSIGAIRILKQGNKSNPHTYQIVNVTDLLSEREHKKKSKGVIAEVTGCYRSENSGVIAERTEVLSEREQQKKEIKEINGEIKEIPPEVQKDIEENERLLVIHRQQKEITALPQSPVYTSSQLLGKSEEFIQKIGFGFTRNPRNILDAIYRQLPEDYQIKEDPKDIELVKSAVNQYESSPASERDALAKKFYNTVESMAKLYLIKKHGEEFRDKLYPEILNKNLIMYLNCNPTFKYCHGGFSNDIDGVYAEITRIVRKKAEKEEKEAQREEEKRIERERVRELMVNRPHYSDEEIHAMGLKTMSEILESSRNKGSEVELLDSKYTPIAPLSDRDRLREEELLRMAMSGQRLNGEEQAEFDYLRRKKAMGIV
jgi:hypothetical protein